jgi:hypothetical protein
MGYIEISDRTYRELLSVAVAWHTTVTGALARLVTEFAGTFEPDDAASTPDTLPSEAVASPVAVFARHAGTRTKATFTPRTRAVAITSGPLAGQSFTTPTAAMCAVIAQRGSARRGPGNGWRFWIVTATGQPIHSLRQR